MHALGDIHGQNQEEKDRKRPREELVRRTIDIPTPKDAAFTVLRGKPAELVLEATSALNQPIEFRLSSPPRAGTLSAFRPVDGSRAAVTYTAGPGTASQDVFTFRVKHRDSPASSSATVRLTIVDPKPQLVVPDRLDLGSAVAGETVFGSFLIENKGTAPYTATFELPAPWIFVTGGEPLTVPAGGKVEAKVAVRPTEPGPLSLTLTYPGVPHLKTQLTALGTQPLRVEPSNVFAAWNSKDRTRHAELTLINLSTAPLEYQINAAPRLVISPATGTLEPQTRQNVRLTLPATETAEVTTLITIHARGAVFEVPFHAEATPPWLRLRAAENFTQDGEVYILPPMNELGTFVVENAGGQSAPLQAVAPEGLAFVGFDNNTVLPPGASHRLTLRTTYEGNVEGELTVSLGEEKLTLPVRTPDPVLMPEPPPPPTSENSGNTPSSTAATSKSRSPEDEARQALLAVDMVGVFPSDVTIDPSLPELPHFTPVKLTPTQLELTFPNVGAEYGYAIFREEYRPAKSDGRPLRFWVPWEGLRFTPNDGQNITTTLKDLVPGRKYIIRFAVRATDGRIGPPSIPWKFVTPPERSWPWKWLLLLLGLAGIGWFGWRHRKRQYM